MSIGRKVAMAAVLSVAAITGFFFTNCSKSLPPEVQTAASQSSVGSQLTPISASMLPASIGTSGSAQVTVTGGRPPYTFAIEGTSSASISENGTITGPFTVGALIVTVNDSALQSSQVALSVVNSVSGTSTGAPCTTPFGTTIADGQTIVAFNTAHINCPSTLSCQGETRFCQNGVLSGSFTAQSCSRAACVFKETAYASDYYSGQSLCQITYNDHNGSTTYGIPQVASPTSLPASCADSDYGVKKYCYTHSVNQGGGEGGTTVYDYHLYTCKGPAETVTATHYVVDIGGGGR